MIRKWNCACSRWRKHCIRRLAQKSAGRRIRRVRTCLAAVLCAEVLTGAGMYWNQNRPELNLVRREEICEVELVPKTALDGMDDEKAVAPEEQDIYGVRLDLRRWKFSSTTGKIRYSKKCIAIQRPVYYNFF